MKKQTTKKIADKLNEESIQHYKQHRNGTYRPNCRNCKTLQKLRKDYTLRCALHE